MSQWIEAIKLTELPEGAMHAITVGNLEILLAHVNGSIYAMGMFCATPLLRIS
jgi:nitrite reductase/ring-hydroxylating ferredoxin subunit